MQLSDSFIKNVEIEYLRIISELLKNGKADRAYAKESASAFLLLLPFTDADNMHDKIKTFCEKFILLAPLHSFVVKEIDKDKTHTILLKMRNLIKNNQIDDAIKLVEY